MTIRCAVIGCGGIGADHAKNMAKDIRGAVDRATDPWAVIAKPASHA